MALYRKHRPQKFADIVGQNHIKKVLTNALMQDKIGHAYLFSGPRGIGKTTIARLLAKALNCRERAVSRELGAESSEQKIKISSSPLTIHPSQLQFEPCNKCISCLEITGDRSLDVIEIDAASNRGIDEIRELRDKVRFAPSNSRFKVYIIDEVHMLTKEAFNALLKTLEEPPKHAIFIMATTELHKVPDTILSRTQQFDFKRASIKEMIDNLANIAKKEKIKISPEALEIIARAGEGSFRDSVSILDQVSSISQNEISENDVKEVLGLVAKKTLDEFISYLENNNVQKAIELINQIYNEGYDLVQFNQTIIESLRQKMLKTGDYSLLEKIKKFIEAGLEMKYAIIPQIPLELAVIESCNTDHVTCNTRTQEHKNKGAEEQNQKLTQGRQHSEVKIEKKIENDNPISNSEKPAANLEVDSLLESNQEVTADNQIINHKSSIINLQSKWTKVIEAVAAENHSLGILLQESQPLEIKNGKLMLGVKFKFYAERISASDKISILHSTMEKILGEKMGVECVVDEVRVGSKSKSEKENITPAQGQRPSSYSTLVNDALEVFGEE